MTRVRVKQPGARTTVEDLGRCGVARYGVPPGGAFDRMALQAANRLLGNGDDDAGLEITLMGPTLEHVGDEPVAAVLVGTTVAPVRVRDGEKQSVRAGYPFELLPGDVLKVGGPLRTARAWLALSGGIQVPRTLGSRSTYVPGSFGGLSGRSLHAGDVLDVGRAPAAVPDTAWRDPAAPAEGSKTLALLPGPQLAAFPAGSLDRLCSVAWQVKPASDRTGVRFAPAEGESTPVLQAPAGIAPEGTTIGAIQIPPAGEPIALGPDRPITGGYAKPALVARAHLGRLASLRPGETVRFETVSIETALEMERERRESLPGGPDA